MKRKRSHRFWYQADIANQIYYFLDPEVAIPPYGGNAILSPHRKLIAI